MHCSALQNHLVKVVALHLIIPLAVFKFLCANESLPGFLPLCNIGSEVAASAKCPKDSPRWTLCCTSPTLGCALPQNRFLAVYESTFALALTVYIT